MIFGYLPSFWKAQEMTHSNWASLLLFSKIWRGIFVVIMITTVTTITTIAVLGLTSTTSIATVLALIVLVGTKELANAHHSRFSLRLAKLVNVGICALALVFAIILVVTITDLL
jgi:hypothetical protein